MAKEKPWRKKRNGIKRTARVQRQYRKRILIVCGGEKTEPNYFKSFKIPTVDVQVIGVGYDPQKIVNEAIFYKNNSRKQNNPFDETWCVFDRDDFPPENINNAFDNAERNNIEIAFSNECFEIWYLLHFEYIHAAISRQVYGDKLSQHLRYPYKKNSRAMYEELRQMQPTAIKNATRLLKNYQPPNPVNDNPSTLVHKLVLSLNKNRPQD